MNVLLLSPTFHPHRGGAESMAEDLARRLVAEGHSVTVVTAANPGHEAVPSWHGAEVLHFTYPRLRSFTRSSVTAYLRGVAGLLAGHRRLLVSKRIDAIGIVRVDEKSVYPALLRPFLGFRLVTYLHGGELRRFQRDSRPFRLALRGALEASHAVVAVSRELAAEAVRFAPRVRGKVFVLPNGVDVSAIRGAAPVARPRRFVLFAGRLVPVKNVRALVEAFALRKAELGDVDLVLAGTGSDEAALRELAAARGLADRVAFLGAVPREVVHGLMRSAELLVLPSFAEGHSMVLLEAAAAGRMVLASRVKGNRGAVADLGNSVAFAPEDHEALGRLLVRYVTDREARAELEERARALDPRRLDLASRVARHVALLSGEAP